LQGRLNDLNSILPTVTNNIKGQVGQPATGNNLQNVMDLDSGFNLPSVMDLDNLTLPERQTQTGVQGQSAVAEALRAREQPRMDRTRQQKEAQLLTRGFNPGTEGWNEAMDDLSRSENDFNLGLTALSGQEQSRLFNLDTENRNTRRAELNDLFGAQMQKRAGKVSETQQLFDAQLTKRQNQVNENLTNRTLPVQEYEALIKAMQPQLPTFNPYQGATVEANPIFNATTQKGLFDLGRYGTSVQGELGSRGINSGSSDSNKSAGASIAGAAIAAMAMSDIRLKTDIAHVGESAKGYQFYTWKWTDEGKRLAGDQPEFGVIAQEVALIDPSAVVVGDDGYMRVDYRRVL
jgi:hypothetical protein